MCRKLRINLYCAYHSPRICFGLPAEALDEDDKTYRRNRLTYSREGIIPCDDEQHRQKPVPKGEAIQLVAGWGTCGNCQLEKAHRLVATPPRTHKYFWRRSREDKVNKAREVEDYYEKFFFEELLDIPEKTKLPMWAHYPWQRNLGRDGQALHLEALKNKLRESISEYYIYDNGTVTYSGGWEGPARQEVFGERGRFCMFGSWED
ncbi:hypothetical protein BJ166DRAFT_592374 [Pestalotiopsis sp. NC0098]|nr:hypothetical protein BJ166DRAFT_592374 [Pestalotiopsis sp. NC0098]